MGYIYKISNTINDKVYIGKTAFSIEKRFKEHCQDAFKEHNEKRPLYSAMRKYGVEHFHIELIEETKPIFNKMTDYRKNEYHYPDCGKLIYRKIV